MDKLLPLQILDHKLTFTKHIEDIISRANRTLGLLRKMTNEFIDPLCIKALFNSLFRSFLEYGSILWCSYTDRWITNEYIAYVV